MRTPRRSSDRRGVDRIRVAISPDADVPKGRDRSGRQNRAVGPSANSAFEGRAGLRPPLITDRNFLARPLGSS